MPGGADPAQSSEPERSRYDKEAPDLVGEELGDNARIWREYDRFAREEDRERIANWNRGLDNLALFAGLFSAVTTAFIIELQNDTEPDYARLTFLVLNASAAGVPFREEPFVIDSRVRIVNCLWISSLLLSLTAALIAIMGKDWIGMYATRPVCNPRQWAEIRTYRLGCVERWYMSGVIASAPVLLHLSLVLFAAGLVAFVAPDPFSQRLALGLSVAAGALYLFTVLSAVLFSASPFKSPATQAFRRSFFALFAFVRQALSYSPGGRPVAILQQATLIIGTLFAHPLTTDLISLDRVQRRRLRRRDFRLFWDRIFPSDSASLRRSWRNRIARLSLFIISRSVALVHALRALPSTFRQEYQYRRQRPRSRPWLSSLHRCLLEIDFSDHWSAICAQPTPETLALAISQLDEMSPSPDTSHTILWALGDLPIGPKVAPLVSSAIRSRLRSQMRHNWRKTDHTTLSRYILVDQNISAGGSLQCVLDYDVMSRFETVSMEPSLRSENSLFAVSKIHKGILWSPEVAGHCPDVITQPRGLQYLLALYQGDDYYDWDGVIILASRYWHHLSDDQSFDLERELQRRTSPGVEESYKMGLSKKSGGTSGLVERLVFLIPLAEAEVAKAAWIIITNVIAAEFGFREHRCLVYAFDDDGPLSVDAALQSTGRASRDALGYLASALPLHQYRFFVREIFSKPSTSDDHQAFAISLSRIIIRLLSPSSPQDWTTWPHAAVYADTSHYLSNVELCIRWLHAQLCHPRSVLDDDSKLELINLMLDNAALVCADRVWELRYFSKPEQTTERGTTNILTAIARQLAQVMGRLDNFDTGARLFILLSHAEAKDSDGKTVTWDLGRYLRGASERLLEQDASAAVSLSRLHSALGALGPFCESREDLRAAWDSLELPQDACDSVPLCDLDLGEFFYHDDPTTRETISEIERPAHAADNLRDWDVSAALISHLYLEASMQ